MLLPAFVDQDDARHVVETSGAGPLAKDLPARLGIWTLMSERDGDPR